MNRYWDLSEKERSELTGDQVRAFLDVELMEKGVAKVPEIDLQPIEDIDLPKVERFIVKFGQYGGDDTGFAFATIEQAQAFIAAQPMKVDCNYQFGYDTKYTTPCQNMSIGTVKLPSDVSVSNAAVVLKKNNAANSANANAEEARRVAMKKVEDATSGVWDDWNECRAKASRCKKLADTRDEYKRLCDGNAELAETFLAKVYNAEEIKEAADWCVEVW